MSDAPASQTPAPLSERQLSSFLEMFAKAQAESNRELVQSLLATSPVNVAPLSSSSLATVKHGNFARCTARFNGACRDWRPTWGASL
ncbi:unnamed protein product [Euphydryas editha]|uniref:Basal-body rod modification protein FlgD n=1 Tax=Euphydryas editha TaxID=104508 RepID=A0AAU9UZ01_EUPED|nr:unnamed protein product [Euphydryas editha]